MIAFVRGVVAALEEESLVVELGGIGLTVAVPFAMLNPRPAMGKEITLYTHLQVREDAWTLYGFTDREQLHLFRLLTGVSGVGAKTALAIVNKLSVSRFGGVMATQDVKALTAISGVGKKTAERILLELKDKFPHGLTEDGAVVGEAFLSAEELNRDLLAALKQLGYSPTEARAYALQAQSVLGTDASSEALLREALKIAMKS